MTGRKPTRKQHEALMNLGSGSAWVCPRESAVEPLLRRGWVTATRGILTRYGWVRITPEGYQALAASTEKYGLPELGPKPQTRQAYCGACRSTYILTRAVDVTEPLPNPEEESR